jgi:hypothetical protein
MRLYIKLLAIMLPAVAFQYFVQSDWQHNETWFAIRCEAAYLTGDEALKQRLVEEARYYVQWQPAQELRNAARGR